MPRRSIAQRSPWEDRFTTPTTENLFEAIEDGVVDLVRELRGSLREDFGLTERLEWCGVPWKWSLTYRSGRAAGAEIIAYLVPNPETPTVVFRLTHEQFATLPLRKLSRHIRDGLAPTRLVAGVCWPEWKFQSPNQVQDLIGLFGLLQAATPSRV